MGLSPHILVLAAGQGKRMHSNLPKVMHPVLFRPMLHYVIDLAHCVQHQSIQIVVGFEADVIKASCKDYADVQFVTQKKQLGTADAVKAAEDVLRKKGGAVVVLCGDAILLSTETLTHLIQTHEQKKAACTFLTATLEKPKGYGRILRDEKGAVVGIREEVDCDRSQKKISEVNSGIYCFDVEVLYENLSQIRNKNKQEEYYLTDLIEILASKGHVVATVLLEDPNEMTGINDRYVLSQVETFMQKQVNKRLMLKGVTLHGPETIFIDSRCRIEADVVVEQGCQIVSTVIEKGVTIEANCRIVASVIAAGTRIRQGSYIVESLIGNSCSVGPYAQLRPGTRLGSEVKIGNFVEIKKSVVRDGAKASHLTYIGDAEIGKNVNLGCGFVTCNFDGGPSKHRTIIEDDVFVGSDSQAVAPVRIGAGSYVASGTTVTEDVPPESLVISRGRQITKPGYARKYRKSSQEE